MRLVDSQSGGHARTGNAAASAAFSAALTSGISRSLIAAFSPSISGIVASPRHLSDSLSTLRFVTQQGHDRNGASTGAFSELPVAALSRPRQTLAVAERVLARSTDPAERSYAGQARGIALREIGDVRAAVRQLRAAVED